MELARERPLLRARDLVLQELPTIVLSRLVAAGKLERVARGVYGLPGQAISEHRSLAEVALRVPQGVVCLLSALRVHGIGTQAPFEVWLAIEHRAPIPRLDQPKIRPVRMSGAAFADGVEHVLVDGVSVPVFNAAKTVADCFKYRNKIGLDVALEALRDGWTQRKFTMDAIWHFATVDRVANVMRPYPEGKTSATPILSQFPFVIKGFHSDNGSEYINKKVAVLLNKLNIEQTKSRSRQSNDNALAESKNNSVVRKHMGYSHIPQKYAQPINEFFANTFNSWLNMHRPCMFATEVVSDKGKIKKVYKHADVKTPLECLAALRKKRLVTFKKGVTLKELEARAREKTDLQAAQEMQAAKAELFAMFNKPEVKKRA